MISTEVLTAKLIEQKSHIVAKDPTSDIQESPF
jgi:hypothetical protein